MSDTERAGSDWLRSRQSRSLLWATLLLCLILGTGVVVVGAPEARFPGQSDQALSDDEAAAQVVAAARRIVSAARLQKATGAYSFQSCATAGKPPYEVVVYATFAVPERDPAAYLQSATDALSADGWTRSPVVGERFGEKLTKDGVVALINRDATDARHAILRVYGECRNWGSHHDDDPAWTEVGL